MLALGHRSGTIAGHSLGGGIAMQLAYQFPEMVDRLVLVSSGGLGREVSLFLRAVTLPGAELVLPLVASQPVINAGAAIARALRPSSGSRPARTWARSPRHRLAERARARGARSCTPPAR